MGASKWRNVDCKGGGRNRDGWQACRLSRGLAGDNPLVLDGVVVQDGNVVGIANLRAVLLYCTAI